MCRQATLWFWAVAVVISIGLNSVLMTSAVPETAVAHPGLAKRHAKVQMCGARLVEMVKHICGGHVFSGYVRRSDPSMIAAGGFLLSEDSQDLNTLSDKMAASDSLSAQYGSEDSYGDKDSEESRAKAHHRFRRNISDECCMKPCSINEMVKYCGSGSRRVAPFQ